MNTKTRAHTYRRSMYGAEWLTGCQDRVGKSPVTVCVGECEVHVACGCMQLIVHLIGAAPAGREGNTGGTDVYSVGSALLKLQEDLLPPGCCA